MRVWWGLTMVLMAAALQVQAAELGGGIPLLPPPERGLSSPQQRGAQTRPGNFPAPASEPASLRAGMPALRLGQEFPFKFREGLIWVEVSVSQRAQPLNFLLDTGAGASVINLQTARQLGLKSGKRVSVQGVGASTVGFWPEQLTAQAGGVPLPRDYLAVDLSLLSGACECPVDGLIGADFFRNQVVQIDFAAGKVRLLESRPPAGEQTVLPLKQSQGSLRVPVGLNQGAPQWVRLDTGCASSLQWVTGAAKGRAYPRQMAVALTGVSIAVAPATVHLGGLCFEGVPTGLHEKSIFSGEAGLLGNGLLSRFASVTIDAPSGRVLLRR